MNASRLLPAAAVVLMACGLITAPARGQIRLEVTTHTGVFQPLRSVLTTETLYIVDPAIGEADTTRIVSRFRHEPDFALGARVTLWLSARLGLEGALLYSFSDVEAQSGFEGGLQGPSARLDANVASGTLRAVMRLNPDPGPLHLDVSAGFGFLTRNGEAFERLESTTDFTFVGGSSISIALAPNMALRLGLEDYVSFAGFTTPPLPTRTREGNSTSPDTPTFPPTARRSGIQNDLVLIQALSVTFSL